MTDNSKLPDARSTRSEVERFLEQAAATPARSATGQSGRLIFALDATASRQPTWDRACQLQGEMFVQTAALGGLEIQLVYYRGFNECAASGWLGDSAALLRHMSRVRCAAGTTQIGKVLRHALDETRSKPVQAVVFVGDALEENIDALAGLAGELGILHVPLFMFQEGRDRRVESAFRRMAQLSGGAWCPFDATSADQLKRLLGAVAVYAAGGHKALADFSRNAGREVQLLTQQLTER